MRSCPDAGALAKRSEDETVQRHAVECRRCRGLVALMEARTGNWHQVDGHWVAASGSLAGRVTRSGVPVAGAEVTIADGEIEYVATSSDDGEYVVESVLPGFYRVKASAVELEIRIVEGANVADLDLDAPIDADGS